MLHFGLRVVTGERSRGHRSEQGLTSGVHEQARQTLCQFVNLIFIKNLEFQSDVF